MMMMVMKGFYYLIVLSMIHVPCCSNRGGGVKMTIRCLVIEGKVIGLEG